MNKDPSDFMLQEYEQIATAYFRLQDQVGGLFRLYLSLVAFPLTILGSALQISNPKLLTSFTDMPPLLSGLLLVISLLGFLTLLTLVSTRLEMLMYARTINCVRGYFANLRENRVCIETNLVLPCTDQYPPFFELWRHVFFIVVFLGVIDGLILSLATINLLEIRWPWAILVGVLALAGHVGVYWYAAHRRERDWKSGRNPIPWYKFQRDDTEKRGEKA